MAGRPRIAEESKKKKLTATIDPVAFNWVRKKENSSQYVSDLLLKEMKREARKA